jgi:UDP-N-acetylglucosamine 2-epimerase
MLLTILYGTRPEFIKIEPLILQLEKTDINFNIVKIQQHSDLILNTPYDIKIDIDDISTNRLDNILLNTIDKADIWLKNTTHLLIQGDTYSGLSAALAASSRNIKILYLESGLRTFNKNNPYPEEMVRTCISALADLHFCPTKQNAINLIQAGVRTPKYVTGNTVLDTIDPTPISQENKVLITMHRRENLPIMDQWFKQIDKLTRWYPQYEFIFPMHPNPEIQKLKHLIPKVKIIKPLSREDLIIEIKKSILIISDSGGICEETNWLKRKLIITRYCTERQECLWNQNASLCKTPEFLTTSFKRMLHRKLDDYIPCFGDSHTSEKIIKILKKELK